jgi:glycosyltransferase involved in cell wall biosynthesis
MSDAVICVSKAQKSIIIKADASLANKTVPIYNPLPEVAYIDTANKGLGYFGGPNCLKGFNVLYQAAAEIKARSGKKTEIHATNFLNISRSFLSRARDIGFSLYGRLNAKEFLKLYRRIRCVVVPSIWPETYSYAAVEALLHGRLVVASNIGALPEVTKGCRGVFLSRPEDYAQLADALLHVESLDEENVIDMGISDRETLMRKFNNEETILHFLGLCTRICENQ